MLDILCMSMSMCTINYYGLFPLRLERLNNTSNNPEHVAIVTRFYTKASEMRATIYIVSQAN